MTSERNALGLRRSFAALSITAGTEQKVTRHGHGTHAADNGEHERQVSQLLEALSAGFRADVDVRPPNSVLREFLLATSPGFVRR